MKPTSAAEAVGVTIALWVRGVAERILDPGEVVDVRVEWIDVAEAEITIEVSHGKAYSHLVGSEGHTIRAISHVAARMAKAENVRVNVHLERPDGEKRETNRYSSARGEP